MRKYLVAISLLTGLTLYSTSYAQQPEIAFSVGVFEVFDNHQEATEIGIEYRFSPIQKAFNLIPTIGLSVNDEGGYWAHAGLRYDFQLAEKWRITPQFAVVAYEEGAGKDLGSAFLFRSGIELGYQFTSQSKLALTLYHMSNADLAKNNPGSESLILTYSYALRK